MQTAEDIMRGHPTTHFENRYLRKDGRVIHVMWTATWSSADRVRVAVARDITEYRKSAQVQAVLYGIVEAAYDADDMVTLCRRLHEVIGALLPAEGFSVALYDASSGTISSPYSLEHDHATEGRTWGLDPASPLAEVIRTGKDLLIAGEGGIARDEPAWLGVPLLSAQGVIGALMLRAGPGAGGFTPEDRRLLQFISHKVAEAIERKQADLKVRHRAYFDLLTGLPNRTLFDDRFDMALKRARRDGENLAILYLDLDGFKRINDELGHEAGDQLLRQMAARLDGCIRDSDTVGRRGGDEFTVLLTNIHGTADIDIFVAKIHAALEEPFQLDGRATRVTASIGAAVFPVNGGDR